MIRTVSLATLTIFLCGVLFSAAWSEPKVPKTPKTEEQIAKWRSNHPAEAAARDQSQAAVRPQPAPQPTVRPNPVSSVPYQRTDTYGRTDRPGSPVVTAPQSHPQGGGGHDQTVVTPYRRDDDSRREGRYGYVGNPRESGRAYELPRRDGYGGPGGHDGYGGPGGHDNHDSGRPYPVYIPQPVYIPEPVIVPSGGYAPHGCIPAPRPRCGGEAAYYPQYEGPYSFPCRQDINSMPLLGSEIIAADGTFLGVIDRDYGSPESIANRGSAFGDPYSRLSIWNPDGPYGSPNAPLSPWNRYSYRPPVLYWHGVFRGYLSTNPQMQPKVSPDSLPKHILVSPWR